MMLNAKLKFYGKNQIKMRSMLSYKRKKLLNFLSFQASTAFYNNFYNYFFNLYLFRLINKYESTYRINTNSMQLGSMHLRHHMIAYNNISKVSLTRSLFQRKSLNVSNINQNIQFFYFTDFLHNKNKTPFIDNVSKQKDIFSINYNKTIFDKNYDTSLLYFTWADFFAPGLFNYSPTRFWFLFVYTPSFVKYQSNWLSNSIDDFYLIFFFARIFTLRLHKTIPTFLTTDLKLIFYEITNDLNLTQERNLLYLKSLEGIFDGLLFFSSVHLQKRSELLFFQGSWLDCLHLELFEETSKWVMPVKNEIDWVTFQGDLDDWWESLFYIFLSESYIWPFTDYSENDFILEWKNYIKNKNFDMMDFFFIDYSFTFLQQTPDSFFSKVGVSLIDNMWINFIEGNLAYTKRVTHRFKFIGNFFLTLNTWVLSGLAGRDRRMLFYRFFYLFILKLRGFFFYWYMMLLKPVVFDLPWHREVHHIETIFITNQNYYKNKLIVDLRETYKNNLFFFSKPFSFLNFWAFFFKNIWSRLVIQKRNKIEPNFILKLERILVRKPKWAYIYTRKITNQVYIALFWDFFYYKLYYWYLIIICFSAWWEVFKNDKKYTNKIIYYFFEEERKLFKLNKRKKGLGFKYIIFNKNSYQSKDNNNIYSSTKLNLIFSLFLFLQRKKKYEINSYWYLPEFTYKFFLQRAVNYLNILLISLFKNMINLIFSLFYEIIVDFNIGRIARLALKNKAEMWFKTTETEYFTSGVRQYVWSNTINKKQKIYNKSLTATFMLFVAKLDNVNWFFLVTLIFYYYPLKFFYFFIFVIFKFISNFFNFYLCLYIYLFNLIIDLKCVIKLYHEPNLKSEISKFKNKERWKLQMKLKSKKKLTKIINYNIHSISFFSYISLHLKAAREEYVKAKFLFKELPQIFPFLLTGEIKPNNYMFYISLFTLCSQFLTTILILIGFYFHWFLWIFRKNWNKWYFFQFLLKFFMYFLISMAFLISLIFFFVGKSLYLSQLYSFMCLWFNKIPLIFFKGYIVLSLYISIIEKKFINNINFLWTHAIQYVNKIKQVLFFFKFMWVSFMINGVNLGVSNIKIFFFVNKIIKFLEISYFASHDLYWYFIYSLNVCWLKTSKILYQFWLCFLLSIVGIICCGYMLYDLYLSFYAIWYKKDAHDFMYIRAFWFFFKTEYKESFISIKELIFIGSLALRFMLMIIGFFIYLIYQIGWRFRIFSSTKDKTKKMWAIPTKYRVLRLLDKWALYFFYRVRVIFFFNLKSSILFGVYILYNSFFYLLSKCIYYIKYIYFFIINILQLETPTFYNILNIYYNKYLKWKKNKWNYYIFIKYIYWFFNKNFIQKYLNKIFIIVYKWYYVKKKLKLISLMFLILLSVFYKILSISYNIYTNNRFIKLISHNQPTLLLNIDFNIRDFQELLVFINKNYNFITFYWATVLQISIDYGDFGWWLPYSNSSFTIRNHFLNITNKWRILSLRDFKFNKLKRKFNKFNLDEKRYHKKHSYYFTLNKITKPLLRKKAFLNDYIYNGINNKKKYIDILWVDKILLFLSKIYYWFGLSFFFEIMYQRFKTPISQFFFSHKSRHNKSNNLFLFVRLQKLKDTLGHVKWHLAWMRDNSKIFILDEFGLMLWKYFSNEYKAKNKYFTRKITHSFYPLTSNKYKFINNLFSYKRSINKQAMFNLIKYLVSILFSILFLFFLIIFFLFFSVFFIFVCIWRVISFFYFFLNFYIKFKFTFFNIIVLFSYFLIFYFLF